MSHRECDVVKGADFQFLPLVSVRIFFRHIVFQQLACPHFALVRIFGVFHAAHRFGFHVLPFFQQFFHAF